MSYRPLLVVCLVLLVGIVPEGCRERSWHKLSDRQLEEVLVDLYVAQGMIQSTGRPDEQGDSIYQNIYSKHGVTSQDVDSTLYYLASSRAALLVKITDQAIQRLGKDVERLEREKSQQLSPWGTSEYSYYQPPIDSVSHYVSNLNPLTLRLDRDTPYHTYYIPVAELPILPDSLHHLALTGVVVFLRDPDSNKLPWVSLSRTGIGAAAEGVTRQLPNHGPFSLVLPDSIPPLTQADTLTVTIYPPLCGAWSSIDEILLYLYDLRLSVR